MQPLQDVFADLLSPTTTRGNFVKTVFLACERFDSAIAKGMRGLCLFFVK
jgi:hypothetical protein